MFGYARLFDRPTLSRHEVSWRHLGLLMVLALIVALSLLAVAPARAGNTTFLTDKNGNVIFPFSPPNRASSLPGVIDNMTIGATTPAAGTFSRINSSGGLPTIASGACGTTTNGAIVAGSTNQAFKVTIGAAATTSCTITFNGTLSPVPKACVFSPMNAAAIGATVLPFIAAPSATSVVFSGALLASTNWSFICM